MFSMSDNILRHVENCRLSLTSLKYKANEVKSLTQINFIISNIVAYFIYLQFLLHIFI